MDLDQYIEEVDGQSPVVVLGLRIKRWRRFLGISQKELATRTQLKRAAIMRYEAGINAPGSEAIIAIAKTGVNSNWLLMGEGPMSHAATGEDNFNQIQAEDSSIHVAILEVQSVLKFSSIDGQSFEEVDIEKFLSSCIQILSVLDTNSRTFLLKTFGRMVLDLKMLNMHSSNYL